MTKAEKKLLISILKNILNIAIGWKVTCFTEKDAQRELKELETMFK